MAGYGDDSGFLSWLTEQGYVLPSGAPTPAVLRQRGSNYLDAAYEWRLQCSRRTGGYAQDRAWPRTGHIVSVEVIPDNLVPAAWVAASYRAAWLEASQPGWSSAGVDPSRLTKREKAGEVEREFFGAGEGAGTGNVAPGFRVDAGIDGSLAIWLCPQDDGVSMGLWAVGSC